MANLPTIAALATLQSSTPGLNTTAAAKFPFLSNRADPAYAGLQVQSSGDDYITDHEVGGYGWSKPTVSGMVCGAKRNFTFVALFGPDGLPNIRGTGLTPY
ncbi:hypothetical protein CORC01_11073 [Colletotrichum orchidophilum]|uniref:Uncharacterized protein n=1 Tax=Colletotrichum orchidophilum TaxID=1209926 RepID=A0A1G4AWR2_9PEZI|nr:uncharacterized protein CORC01_11073 [Colletotrichum orchidophilum]OHE93574.1 hypothetical protein CORC01_11073 [Colletotrichum orchidophilum]